MSDRAMEALRESVGNRYAVEGLVGQGGMATVYVATDLRHKRKVALKVIRADLSAALETERFQREIDVAAQLTHPNILPLYDSGEAQGLLFYVMPYIEGESLEERLARESHLPIDDAIYIAQQVAQGLQHAHEHGVIHRDIKPANILLVGGQPLIADFGIAHVAQRVDQQRLTTVGLTVGTPDYMSPEQGSSEDGIDGRADIYSLGCVLYQMLAGEPPFSGRTVQAVMIRHATDPVPPVRTVRATVTPALQQIIEIATAKVPADRYATAGEMAAALERERKASGDDLAVVQAPFWRRRAGVAALAATTVAAAALLLPLGPPMEEGVDSTRSIAVLPFVNRSAEADAQYFVDGVHDDLLTQLVRMNDLKVISRTSVLEYRDDTKSTRQIGEELGVATLLDGAVQRSGDRVRITAQLVDARSDEQMWAQSYDRELTPANIFDIQTEIARAIADELAATLVRGNTFQALDRAPTLSQEAFDLYLRARAIPFDGAVDDLWRGIDLAEAAVEMDPQFALAMGQVAENYINIYWFTTQQAEHRDAAQGWIDRALAITPDDPRLQLVLGELLYTGYLDYDGALAALDKAQRGMPGESSVYLNRGAVLRRRGDFDGAIEAFEMAQTLDPRDAFNMAHHIFTFLYTGDVAGARRQGDRILSLPTATTVHIGFTRMADLFLLGDTKPFSEFIRGRPDVDLGPEDQLKVMVPLLERRYEDALAALETLPDPIEEQTNLWTHSFVRARIAHARGDLDTAREQAGLAVDELTRIADGMPTNARPVVARALMHAVLGQETSARADIRLATDLYPIELDILDGPIFVADGLRALAVFADTPELVGALDGYLSLDTKLYYVDYLLLDPVFDRHRSDPAIQALQAQYTLDGTVQ